MRAAHAALPTEISSAPVAPVHVNTTALFAGQSMSFEPYFPMDHLTPSNDDANDRFGYTVAIDGNTAVVGAPHEASNGSDPDDNSAPDSGAVYVFVRSGSSWYQQGYFKATNSDAYDQFGTAVAIDGDTIVVGANLEDGDGSSEWDNSAVNSGAAYVFVRNGSTWSQQAYLKASNAEYGDFFGTRVAISDNTIVIGANGEDSDGSSQSDNSASHAGAAYVFAYDGSNWTQQAYLKAPNADYGDDLVAVAIDGDTIAIGAIDEASDGNGPSNNATPGAGAVYIFERSGTNWLAQDYLKAPNPDISDHFGHMVGLNGDTLVVSAWGEDSDGSSAGDNSAPDAGAVYIFQHNATNGWVAQAYLKASDATADDRFGISVAMHGQGLVVGADEAGANNAGAAYFFRGSGSNWQEHTILEAANGAPLDRFGYSVGFDGDTLIVGAPDEEVAGATSAGAASIFWTSAPIRDRMHESLGAFTFDPTDTDDGATLGTAFLDWHFEYDDSNGVPLENIFLEITQADNAFLLNGDSGLMTGVGANFAIANADLPGGDQRFDPGETLIVQLEIGYDDAPGTIDFELYGKRVGDNATASQIPLLSIVDEPSSSHSAHSGENHQNTIFLPLVSR